MFFIIFLLPSSVFSLLILSKNVIFFLPLFSFYSCQEVYLPWCTSIQSLPSLCHVPFAFQKKVISVPLPLNLKNLISIISNNLYILLETKYFKEEWVITVADWILYNLDGAVM